MRTRVILVLVPTLLLGSASARAHFKLQQPADWLQTDQNGDPLSTASAAGTQKSNPCGQGMPSGAITRVPAGSVLHVKLTETIPHGGHYRIALLPKLNPTNSDIPEPAVTLNAGQCGTAAIQSPVVAPILADNLFPHTQAEATPGKVWETDVQLPNQTGSATLQILEFMTPHAPPCFYHHCAQLELVAADAGGFDWNSDAGHAGPVPTTSGTPPPIQEGCGIGRRKAASNATMIAAFGILLGALVRRYRRTW